MVNVHGGNVNGGATMSVLGWIVIGILAGNGILFGVLFLVFLHDEKRWRNR